MRRLLSAAATLALVVGCKPDPARQVQVVDNGQAITTPLTFKAADGIVVHARDYPTENPRALILLFHQAGSSKDEYTTIAPRLAQAGYRAVAIDQRSGGDLFGTNETAAGLGAAKAEALSKDAGFQPAKQDMQATIDWAKTQHLPVILWGSSYSSSLVFPLAVENAGTVKAILAFSPGEYFDDKTLIERAAAKLRVPAYVTEASKPDEIAMADTIVHAAPAGLVTHYLPKRGVHGSSTLIAAKDPQGAADNWMPVAAFLRKVAP